MNNNTVPSDVFGKGLLSLRYFAARPVTLANAKADENIPWSWQDLQFSGPRLGDGDVVEVEIFLLQENVAASFISSCFSDMMESD